MKKCKQLPGLIAVALLASVIVGCGESTESPKSSTVHAVAGTILSLPETPPSARLPRGVSPEHYRLHLNIDPRKTTFNGSAEIDIALEGSTDFFWMHRGNLNVSSAQAVLANILETIRLCAAFADSHKISSRDQK